MDVGEATKARLLEIAAPSFAQKGFAAVSIRELAQAADVNSAQISYYFGGKEGLYQAVLEAQFAPIGEMLEKARRIPLEEGLRLYTQEIVAVHQRSPYLLQLMTSELANPTASFDVVVKKYILQIFAFLSEALQEGTTSGIFRDNLNVWFTTVFLAGSMNFFFIAKPLLLRFAPLPELADEAYVAQAADIFLHGVMRRERHE